MEGWQGKVMLFYKKALKNYKKEDENRHLENSSIVFLNA